jgi:uncharacterized protein
MKSRRLAFALILLGATSAFIDAAVAQPDTAAPAQTTTASYEDSLEAAKELFSLMSGSMVSYMTTRMVGQMWPSLEASLRARYPNLDDSTLADLRGQLQALMVDFVSGVMKQAPAIYARSFSAQEMHDMIAFYRTPTGAKALRTLPQISAELGALMLPQIPALQQKVGATLQNVLQAHGFKDSP